jgi:hypothetical protein
MNRIVEFPLKDGGSILVEVNVSEAESRLIKACKTGDLFAKAALSFEDALDTITPITKTVIMQIEKMSNPPHEISVEFGLNLKAGTGAVLASMSAEANLKINLKWARNE